MNFSRVFVAEKPSLARAIAEEIGVERKSKGAIFCKGNSVVTWCFGHLMELAEPDYYTSPDVPRTKKGTKVWRVDDLPILPSKWVLKPRSDSGVREQLKLIGELIAKADAVVNAGDPDREGQLLIDEVLEHFKCKKTTLRFWVSAIDPKSIQAGLGNLRPNSEFSGMRDAAMGRQRADWLLGMNLSRAYTLKTGRGLTYEERKKKSTLTVVGRVQTPTLALVARRDYAIAHFVPVDFIDIYGRFRDPDSGQPFVAKWVPKKDADGMDLEGKHFIDLKRGKAILNALNAQLARGALVKKCENRHKAVTAPKPFSLADIQRAASARFGFTAAHTLEICQSLYETHKVTSYPRSDCSYLPENQFADALQVMDAIANTCPDLNPKAIGCNAKLHSPAWDNSKITAHHALIPTTNTVAWDSMTSDEKKIYKLISVRYLEQFLPEFEYDQTSVELEFGGEKFTATGSEVTREGWKKLEKLQPKSEDKEDKAEDEDVSSELKSIGNSVVPSMRVGTRVASEVLKEKIGKTSPPPYFTEGTLIAAMEFIHRAFKGFPDIETKLKDSGGIGTPATRAGIISELRKREFLIAKGKKIMCSDAGREMLKRIDKRLLSAALTAKYEGILKDVELGKTKLDTFVDEVKSFVSAEVEKSKL